MNKTRIRRKLFEEQSGKCYYCKNPVHLAIPKEYQPWSPACGTLDHIVPKSKGGMNVSENLVLSCYKCNSIKADRLIDTNGPLV